MPEELHGGYKSRVHLHFLVLRLPAVAIREIPMIVSFGQADIHPSMRKDLYTLILWAGQVDL
jgi:hypothetical protein